ncbi:MAG: MFS transporter [Candidatus Methylacidiphilales bacterium]|nr:MFS transporter [Candidatus Methylacidiphilales bacterium]
MNPTREQITFRLERIRAVASGVVEPLGGTFFLMIAIKFYGAGDTAQAIAATGGSAGLLLGPPVVSWVQGTGWPVNRVLAGFQLALAFFLLLAAWVPWLPVYVAAGLVTLTLLTAAVPLATEFYQQNYPPERRGTLFSISSTIRLGFAAVVTWAAGEWMVRDPANFRALFTLMAAAAAISGWLLARSPGDPLDRSSGSHPFRALSHLGRDKAFRWLIVIWMFMGFGNLMMTPLRVKFLVEPHFGFAYSEAQAAFLIGVVPSVVIFCLTWWWGKLFDRINFFVLRAFLNITFLLSNLFFFLVGHYWGFLVGMLLLGVSFAGGNVAWSLWVTKIARPEHVADYMSVHTFMTGLRGVVAPMLAVYLASVLPMPWIVALSSLLILVSLALIGPELNHWHRRRKAQPVAEGIAE